MKNRIRLLSTIRIGAIGAIVACSLAAGPDGAAVPSGAGAVTPPKHQAHGPVDLKAFRHAVKDANMAMDAGDFESARAAYDLALQADPSSAPALFNRGVAQYRSGDFEAAAESFATSASNADARLAAASMFNQGNSIYADALRQLPKEQSPPANGATAQAPGQPKAQAQPDLNGAIEAVKKAFTHYKDAAIADQSDADARVNAETAHRLLEKLEEMRKQQEEQQKQNQQDQQQDQKNESEDQQQNQQQDQPQDQKQDQKQDPKDDQKQDQKNEDNKGGEEQPPKDQSQQQSPQDRQEDSDKQDSKDDSKGQQDDQPKEQKPKEQDPKQEPSKEQPQDASGKKDGQSPGTAGGQTVPGAPLSNEDAQRILQGVRDREKARKEAKEAAQTTRQAPTSKDW